jgi:GMP synthase (glutamine-hydrolysing)
MKKFNTKEFIESQAAAISEQLAGKKVLCALSGGVDSAVTAALIHKVAPDALVCVFVDHGLMRKHEAAEVMRVFKDERGMNVIKVDGEDRFLGALKGVTDPEQKRKIIGAEFIKVFEEEAKKLGKVEFLAQGTIKPDVDESGVGAKLVKSHHNVGGLPAVMDFEGIIEPLRTLYKDDVRKVGLALGLPKSIVMRQPFPGPGLGIRVMGEVTRKKLDIVRDADHIYREEIERAKLPIWQYFAFLAMQSVGVRNGERTYEYAIGLRAVNSTDGVTADWVQIPYKILRKVSARITSEVANVSRVIYDITTKPPSTIEWE